MKKMSILLVTLAFATPVALALSPSSPDACTNGLPCDDGNPCTLSSTCVSGSCVGTSYPPFYHFCSDGTTMSIPTGPGAATPYPSTISVSTGPTVCKVRVTFDSINHTNPDDLDVMLSGPAGQNAKIMSDVGGTQDTINLGLILDDDAASPIPDGGPFFGFLAPDGGGIWRPNDVNDGTDTFPAPAPAPTGGSALSVFKNSNPNGAWNLWVVDDRSGDEGSLRRWCVQISFLCSDDSQCSDGNPCTVDTCVNGLCGIADPQGPPGEVKGVRIDPDKQTVGWISESGAMTYDVVRGDLNELPVGPGGVDEVCFDEVSGSTLADPEVPAPGMGYWYLVNAANCFYAGSYGTQRDGTERVTSSCP